MAQDEKSSLLTVSKKFWDVHIPAPSTSLKGKITHQRIRRLRRISLEVHRIIPAPLLPPKVAQDDTLTWLVGKVKYNLQQKFTSATRGESTPLLPTLPALEEEEDQDLCEHAIIRVLVPKVIVSKAAVDLTKGTVGVAVDITKGTVGTAMDITKGSINVTRKGATAIQSALRRSMYRGSPSTENIHDFNLEEVDEDAASTSTMDSSTSTVMVDEEDDIINSSSPRSLESSSPSSGYDNPFGKKWTTKYTFDVRHLQIVKMEQNICTVHIQIPGETRQERKIYFDTEEVAKSFMELLYDQQRVENLRLTYRLKLSLGELKISNLDERRDLLIEIVGAERLSMNRHCDPFVTVILDGDELHHTSFIPNCHDPIWTLKTHSVFILSKQIKELLLHETGLEFIVKDHEVTGLHRILGAVKIHPRDLLASNGERIVVSLSIKSHSKLPAAVENEGGKLAIRCRLATDEDKRSMSHFVHNKSSNIVFSTLKYGKNVGKDTLTAVNPLSKGNMRSFIIRTQKKKYIDGQRLTLMKVRPYPDPARKEETAWMTSDKIQQEVMKPSLRWKELGCGGVAKIYLEILGCDGLPNMDTGGMLGNKTDCFVNAIFESSTAQTDVIDDCLSPRWLPWTQRAFIFNMVQSNSDIYLGIFDWDENPFMDNDMIGKVTLDLSGLLPGQEYLLEYSIYNTSYVNKREIFGTLKLRLRWEMNDPRSFILSSIQKSSSLYINVDNKKDFSILHQTLNGKYDVNLYNRTTLMSYVDELSEYKYIMLYIQDAVICLFLWRGQFQTSLKIPFVGRRDINLPIHSIFAFLLFTFSVENPSFIPSIFFILIGWLLLAVMSWREQHPNPWFRTPNFIELAELLILKKSIVFASEIAPNEKKVEAETFEAEWNERKRLTDEEAKKQREDMAKEQLEAEKEIGDTDVDISSKKVGINIDPLKYILYPLQQTLGMICVYLRIIRNILTWEEPFISFWLVVLSFGAAIISLFIPWFFLLKWITRIVIWTIFGPWMMLLDHYYYRKIESMTTEEKALRALQAKIKRQHLTKQRALKARIDRENMYKLRDAKEMMFGSYVAKVPAIKIDRYRDTPLASSSAKRYNASDLPANDLVTEVDEGQYLVGDMIPRVKHDQAKLSIV